MFVETKFFHKAGEGSGSGGGDQHNLGWYATKNDLETAHPTASAGDYAIVGSTDTVWVWDTDEGKWVNTGQQGQVTSVNGQTGDVTVQATLVSGTNIKSVNNNTLLGSGNLELSTYLTYPAGWTTTGTTKAFCDAIAADTSAVVGKAYLGEVTLSDLPESMVNGEIVVEIMDGTTAANKVIVLTLTSGNAAPYMWKYTYWNGGTDVSGWQTWATSAQGAKADTAVQPGDLATVATTGAYSDLTGAPTIPAAQVNSDWNASSGVAEILNKPTLATVATSGAYSDLTGTPTIPAAIQVSTMPTAVAGELGNIYQFIGTTDANYTNGYFYKCVSDGQNPATYSWTQTDVQPQAGSSLPSQTGNSGKFLTTDGTDASWATVPAGQTIQVNTLPTADATQVGRIVQYVGTTSGNNIYGLFYKCYEYQSRYYWTQIDVVPDYYVRSIDNSSFVLIGKYQTGGEFLHVTAVGYNAKVYNYGVALGDSAVANRYGVGIGYNANVSASNAVAIGAYASATYAYSIQLGRGTNSTANTFSVGLSSSDNYRLLDSDGTIPTDRYTTTPSADGTYVPTLTISSGVATRSWSASGGGGSTAATGTLVAADWSSSTQTISVTGVTASNNVIVAPAPASQADYTTAGIICTAQGAGTLTFTCTSTPSSDLTVNVLII